MTKTAKEIAFLRGLTVEPEWTEKFTDIFDETFEIGDIETLTYINAGAGNHAIELQDRLGKDTEVFAVCETPELQEIAQVKAEATKSSLDFSTSLPLAGSDLVVADASLVRPSDLEAFLSRAVGASTGEVVFFLPTSGSFGEIFSYLWEVLLDLDLLGRNEDVEHLITDLPTVSGVGEIFGGLRMKKIATTTRNEVFEFENGDEFINSPLVRYFFFPVWLGFLDEGQEAEVIRELGRKIDEECGEMSFRFTVKATIMSGEKGES